MVRVGSAAWVTTVVGATSIVIGAFLFTVLDPVMQTFFGSSFFTSTTTFGIKALRWQQDIWSFVTTAILIFVLVLVFVQTRRT